MASNTNADAVQVKIHGDSWVTQMKIHGDSSVTQMKIHGDSWVIQIKERLKELEEQEEEKELCASVSAFNVSRELLFEKPEAYIPQSVSIGPYHHGKSEKYDMDRHKLAAAYRFHKTINGVGNFQLVVVDEFKKYHRQIRSCYHNFINYTEETLGWIMALDAVFLLQCLQFYVRYLDQSSHDDVKNLGRALCPTCHGAADNYILRDLMILKNQLPLFLMKMLLVLQLGSKAKAEERLSILLKLVYQELSPFVFKVPENSYLHINERGHLLEVLYSAIASPLSNYRKPDAPYPADISTVNPIPTDEDGDESDPADMSTVTEVFKLLWKALLSINAGPVRQCLMELATLLYLSVFKCARTTVKEPSSQIIPPSRKELAIPSVAELYLAGVTFSPTDGDLTTILFVKKDSIIYLPKLKFDTNTEVILRNLIAFEASAAPGALIFREYTDFMNGMIDGIKDVKLLRESGIICNGILSDREVANLWNSLGHCASVINVGYLDKVVRDLKRCYRGKRKVTVVKFMNDYIFASWKFLSLVAAVILLIVTCLQAYCSVYRCRN